jgi:hypothetical protein
MKFVLFNNKILTTPKCGTRYLRQRWGGKAFAYYQITNFSNVKYMIVREPIEHLKTALHTEFYNHQDIYGYPINLNVYLDKLILNKKVEHWSYNVYEVMYWIYIKSNKKIKIMHLTSLTDIMKEEGHIVEYIPSDYTFNDSENWMNKNDFFNKLLNDFPEQMQILLKQSDKQTILYNKLINNTLETQSLI